MKITAIHYRDNVNNWREAKKLFPSAKHGSRTNCILFNPPLEVKEVKIGVIDDTYSTSSPDGRGERVYGEKTQVCQIDGKSFPFPFSIQVDGETHQTGGHFGERLHLKDTSEFKSSFLRMDD